MMGVLTERWGKRLGAMLQGLVLGTLLAVAILELLALTSGAAVFVYQGF